MDLDEFGCALYILDHNYRARIIRQVNDIRSNSVENMHTNNTSMSSKLSPFKKKNHFYVRF